MNAKQFLAKHGDAETERVCIAAGTSLVYFKQCANDVRTFGRATAERLEEASDGRMTRVELVFPELPPAAIHKAFVSAKAAA